MVRGSLDKKSSADMMDELLERLEALVVFDSSNINALTTEFCHAKSLKTKEILMPMRMMVTGKKASPPLFETMAVLGKERCRFRIRAAVKILRSF